MFKREMNLNLKSFIVWTSILLCLFLIIFLIYPSIINSTNMQLLDEMMSMFPEEVLKAFNMDITSIDSAFGWLKTEGFVFILLITAIYSSILGTNILLKEENDKTIEYLNTLPITRNQIIFPKLLCGITYIFTMVVIIGLFNFIGLSLSGPFDQKTYLLLSITPIFPSIVFFSLCLFLSTFTHKTKKTIGISLGLVFISYFLKIISELSSKVNFLKYLSIFTLADIRNVITTNALNPILITTSIIVSLILIKLTFIHYNQKELI